MDEKSFTNNLKPIAARPATCAELVFGKLPADGYVREPKVLEVYPVSRSSLRAEMKAGTFPAGILLSPRVRAWEVNELRAHLASLQAKGGAA